LKNLLLLPTLLSSLNILFKKGEKSDERV
jgi:hypothetical protein